MRNPIPDEALDDRLSFVGTAGSGKTYNAMGRVERLLARHNRVVIPDPLGVWWGLRLAADGKAPSGYDVVIFGGPHGDLPLTEHVGALIGETVAGMKESCILDLSQLGTKAAERRFMLAFLTALYRNTPGEPLHVVFDECDMWAPQKLLDKEGEAAKLLGMMETLVRRGRVKGFIPWLITQRPAVISKDILSQVDGMVAFKLTGAHDRNAIGAWVEGQADRDQWKAIDARLPTMERGQGVIWLPGRGILDTVQFPAKATFDSSRTPKRGEKTAHADLPPLDLGKLKEKLASVEIETKANDPAALKKRIRDLEAEVAKRPGPAVDETAVNAAFDRGLSKGAEDQRIADQRAVTAWLTSLRPPELPATVHRFQRADVTSSPKPPTPYAPVTPQPRQSSGNGNEKLPKAERLILTVLAQRQPERVPVDRVAAIAGYSAGGGGFNNSLSSLRGKGYIEPGQPLAITVDGLGALGDYEPLPTGPDLLRHWTGRLGKAERAALEALAECGGEAGKDLIADRARYAINGGGFNNALSRLRTLGLIEGSGVLRLHEDLR
jgi:hypothetical protein